MNRCTRSRVKEDNRFDVWTVQSRDEVVMRESCSLQMAREFGRCTSRSSFSAPPSPARWRAAARGISCPGTSSSRSPNGSVS